MRIARSSSLLFGALMALLIGGAVGFVGAQALGWAGALLGLAPAAVIVFFSLRSPLRRRRAARRAFPSAWHRWLVARVPFYARLEDGEKRRFERDVQFFLDEHIFEGVEGVAVTDDLRLAVAAGAALLLHGRPGWELAAGCSILFYPDRFDEAYQGGDYAAFDGMAHTQGPVLLSAKAVRESWADAADGSNVVLHELAHLFDFQRQGADGVPSLMAPGSEASWRALMRREMHRIGSGRSMLRPYAASAPSEFFAVAVEVFFERPAEMHRRHTDLYDALANFFNLDPAAAGMEERTKGGMEEGKQQKEIRSDVKNAASDLTRPFGA